MSTLHNRGPPAGPCGAAELHELSQYHYQTQTQRVSRISPERVSRISPVAHRPGEGWTTALDVHGPAIEWALAGSAAPVVE